MVVRIYPPELQLQKANASDTEAQFLDLHLFISNGFVLSKIDDKREDFDFEAVFFFRWGRSPFYLLLCLIIQLIRSARVSSHVTDFNALIKFNCRAIGILTLKKFSKFYRRHYEFDFMVGLKSLLQQGLSEPEFYGDLVYKLKKKMLVALIFLISSEKNYHALQTYWI